MDLKGKEISPHKCQCGKPLFVVRDKEGKILGVTHDNDEDEEYHYGFFNSQFEAINQNKN